MTRRRKRHQNARSKSSPARGADKAATRGRAHPGPADVEPFDRLAFGVAFSLSLVVLIQSLLHQSPNPWWDYDPEAQALHAFTGMSPMAVVWLHVATMLIAAVSVGLCIARGRRLHRWSLGLAGFGAIGAIAHMATFNANIYTLSTWLGALAAGIAALHVGTFPIARRWLVACLAGLLLVFVADAATYVFVEHPMTLEQFESQREAFFKARGWLADSTQAIEFERRMRFSDATGRYGLSNVFGSVLACLSVVMIGITLRDAKHWRSAAAQKRAALPLAAAVLGLWAIYLTGSKGAMIGFIGGVAFLGAMAVAGRWRRLTRLLPWAMVLLVLAAIGLVGVRYAMGPPDTHEGERSLLFRAYYWQGAARIIGEEPVMGSGPARFKALYTRVKNPLSPEEVTSTHNALLDYLSMLGVFGVAWAGLLVMLVWQACKRAQEAITSSDEDALPPEPAREIDKREVSAALAFAAVAMGVRFIAEFPANLLLGSFIAWGAGVMALVLCTSLLMTRGWLRERGMTLGLTGGAVTLLFHNQIEMTFYHQGACVLAWMAVGLAAAKQEVGSSEALEAGESDGDRDGSSDGGEKGVVSLKAGDARAWRRYWPAGVMVAFALVFAGWFGIAYTRQQSALYDAAVHRQRANDREAVAQLRRASDALPTDPLPYRWRAILRLGEAVDVEHAAMLAGRDERSAVEAAVDDALAATDEGVARGVEPMFFSRLRARLQMRAASLLESQKHLEAAAEAFEQAITDQPHDVTVRIEAGDVLWKLEQYNAAREQYREALRINKLLYLDPADQLTEGERAHVEERLVAEMETE